MTYVRTSPNFNSILKISCTHSNKKYPAGLSVFKFSFSCKYGNHWKDSTEASFLGTFILKNTRQKIRFVNEK